MPTDEEYFKDSNQLGWEAASKGKIPPQPYRFLNLETISQILKQGIKDFCQYTIAYNMLPYHTTYVCEKKQKLQFVFPKSSLIIWTASREFGTYRLCEQRRFRRACASAQSHQNLRCSLIETLSQEEPSDRKPDPWPLWMIGHAHLKFVITECSKTQICLTGLI